MTEHHRGRGISLLVPFKDDGTGRQEIFDWLRAYYRHHLPHAEFIVGTDWERPFSKAVAVNAAASRANGDVFVLLDADCYIDPDVIEDCAHHIRLQRMIGRRRWYVPYRRLFRLTRESTQWLMCVSPREGMYYSDPPNPWDIENAAEDEYDHGHWYGALIQIMPREAFELVGGMDERFRGWGSEDVSFVMAVDTLFAKYRTTDNMVLTPWHGVRGERHHRMWEGQESPDVNSNLGMRYRRAWGDAEAMAALVLE